MAKKTKTKLRTEDHPIPRDDTQADEMIYSIGELQRHRTRIETELNERIAKLKAEAEAENAPVVEKIHTYKRGLHAYCEANRDRLTRSGKMKTYRFGNGEVSWRIRPPSVVLRNVANVLALLKSRSLTRFIRTKEEVDKEAILKSPDDVAGIRGIGIAQGEDFIVKPLHTELEEIADA